MSKANDQQVGGKHYYTGEGGMQVWDIIGIYGFGYMEGNVVRYISRHRIKNGTEDLKKALHYTEKLIEVHNEHRVSKTGFAYPGVIEKFINDNRLERREARIIKLILNWSTEKHLQDIAHHIKKLIEMEYSIGKEV